MKYALLIETFHKGVSTVVVEFDTEHEAEVAYTNMQGQRLYEFNRLVTRLYNPTKDHHD